MDITDFKFIPLDGSISVSNFDCGEPSVNDFLKEDALLYQQQRLANTYVFIDENNNNFVVAYFSISNDCLVDRGEDKGYNNKVFNRLHRKESIPNSKRIKQYPSTKVGRLGVSRKYQGTGLAYQLMDIIKGIAIIEHKPAYPACKFLLLDALNKEKQIKFYEKNQFAFLLDDDIEDTTRIMYFNLERLA
ncbi:MAG: GNAT family N-acetyltransferase [Bacteroidota bacterium]